ncbi:MAG: MoxR family ATPase [Verrucomicrobiota bacterium]|jgi:MoxR-like ATPase|nr:MoxR family ATPase [Verrucomicrobiota bacterium]
MNRDEIEATNQQVIEAGAFVQPLLDEAGKVIVGQSYLMERLVVSLLANGHVLLEGVPGLAKTLAIKTLSDTINIDFSRIQFTPDMLPADVTGTQIYNPQSGEFTTRQGPVFANLVLADEINRAPAKVQSALLEAMQEKQVTIGETSYPLPTPFLVMATENPIEQEGTYPLPEAQVDRFMLKVVIDYPEWDEERRILDDWAKTEGLPEASQVVTSDQILAARKVVDTIYVDDKVKDYIVNLVCSTRDPEKYKIPAKNLIDLGASPRATIFLTLAAKSHAFVQGRGYVTPHDVKGIAMDVLRHRVHISYEAEAQGKNSEEVIQLLLDHLPVP